MEEDFKKMAKQINSLNEILGINENAIETGRGILKDQKKINEKIDNLEERLRQIEAYEIKTNEVVKNILQSHKFMIKIGLTYFGYSLLKDIGNTDLVKAIFSIIKSLFL